MPNTKSRSKNTFVRRLKMAWLPIMMIVGALALIAALQSNMNFSTDTRSKAASNQKDFLQAQGKDLMYRGIKVTLRGVNFDNIGALGADIGTNNVDDIYINESDYAGLEAMGGNHARLGLSYTWWEKDKAHFFEKVDQQIQWAKDHHIWVTLLTFTNPDGNNGCYEGYGNTCSLWTNSQHQAQLQNFWLDVANHYKDNPVVAGYDLVNEPTPPGPGWCKTWYDMAQRMRNAVTDVAPNQLIFIESCSDPTFDRVFTEKDGVTKASNVVYETHDYDPMAFTHSGYNPSPGSIKTYPGNANTWVDGVERTLMFDKATMEGTRYPGVYSVAKHTGLEWSNQNNVPLYIGEWGSQGFTNGYQQYIRDKADIYNKLGINHAYYTWKHDVDGAWRWGMISSDGKKRDQSKIDAVALSLAGSIQPRFETTGTLPSPVATVIPSPISTSFPTPSPVPTVRPTPSPSPSPVIPTVMPSPSFRPAPTPVPSPVMPSPVVVQPVGFPRALASSNSKVRVIEVQAPQAGKAFIRAESDGSFVVHHVDWYINGKWAATDNQTPYYLGSDKNGVPNGFTLANNAQLRTVVYYDAEHYVDGYTTYTPPVSVTPQASTKPAASPTPSPTPTSNQVYIDIFNEWSQGYCARLVVKNMTDKQINNWQVTFDMNQAKFTSKWNARFYSVLGKVLVLPAAETNYLPAFGSNDAVDWCATKTGSNWRPTNAAMLTL